MTTTEICILAWAILGMIVVAILLHVARMNAEEKFLIDVALFALIVAMWIRWRPQRDAVT
jgi:hypothetical protein